MSDQEAQENLLSRDDLFRPQERRYRVIGPLPVRGGKVRLQSLTEREASQYEAASYEKGSLSRARMEDSNRRYIALCLVDQVGNRLLAPADVPKMADWDRSDMVFLYNEAVNHVNAKRPAIEDVEKNSAGTPVAG